MTRRLGRLGRLGLVFLVGGIAGMAVFAAILLSGVHGNRAIAWGGLIAYGTVALAGAAALIVRVIRKRFRR